MFSTFEFNGARSIDASGRVFSYTSSDYADNGADPRLEVFADGSSVAVLMPGGVIELPETPRQWRVVPVVALPVLSGLIQVGEGIIRPATVNGTVSVVDAEVSRVFQGSQGVGIAHRVSGAAAVPVVALCMYNAAKNGILRSLVVDSPNASAIFVWVAQVSAEPTFTARFRIRNKLISNAATSFDFADGAAYALNDSTTLGSTAPDSDPTKFSNWQLLGVVRPAGAPQELIRAAPMVLPPGYAIAAVQSAVNTTLYMRAEVELAAI